MTEDARTFDQLKAEQDRLCAESDAQPEPEGYRAWFNAQVEEAIRECDKPDAVFYTQEEIEQDTELQIRSWRNRERRSA